MNIPILSSLMQKLKGGDRPPFEKYYIMLFLIFLAYLIGDLVTLSVREHLLPTTVPPKKILPLRSRIARTYTFPEITNKNIFNSDHKIPPTLAELEGGGSGDGTPRLSSLPLDLIGTIVHANPRRSISTVNVRGQNKVEAFSVGQNISNMAEVKEIQREKLIFRNLQTQALEFIEIPHEQKIVLSTDRGATVSLPQSGEEKTNFSFQREEIEEKLKDIGSLLQQARAVPETGPDGQIKGFCLVEMQPGSFYEKLGLRIGDCIRGVNGEKVDSAQKAMGLYNDLKTSNNIKLDIDRSGSALNLNYDIK